MIVNINQLILAALYYSSRNAELTILRNFTADRELIEERDFLVIV